jgi:hypothetical protein
MLVQRVGIQPDIYSKSLPQKPKVTDPINQKVVHVIKNWIEAVFGTSQAKQPVMHPKNRYGAIGNIFRC